jgi:hypothetical protein
MLIVENELDFPLGTIMRIRGYGPRPSPERQKCCKFSRPRKSLRFTGIVSRPKIKNISLYRNSDLRYKSRRPEPTEGRFAIVTIRRAWDAMDAAASGGFFPPDENAYSVRRNRVVLAPRPWRQASGHIPPATVANNAAHRGEHV